MPTYNLGKLLQADFDVTLVVGDDLSILQMAEIFKEVYGVSPSVKRQGTLDELHAKMKDDFQKNPANVHAWVSFLFVGAEFRKLTCPAGSTLSILYGQWIDVVA